MRLIAVVLLFFASLSDLPGQKPQSEDDYYNQLIQKAYEKLEELRAEFNKNCRGSAAGSGYCKGLAGRIKELEESIADLTRPRGNDQPNQNKSAASERAGVGGVDFTDLHLIYVKEDPPGGLSRAYSVPFQNSTFDTSKAAAGLQLSQKALLTGLLIPQEKFWVNLNPSEPDRIADREFGGEVARVMLQSDLRLKKNSASITDPRSSAEARSYWQRLREVAGLKGGVGELQLKTRVWIVPGRIEMAGNKEEAYLKKAELNVELESEYLGSKGAGELGLVGDSRALKRSEAIEKEFVLPKLRDMVNTAPEYTELRQVFAGLVLAAWRRQHVPANSGGTVAPDSLLSQHGWTPRATWLEYRRSVEKGEYDFTEETRETHGDVIITRTTRYFDGGVDFTRISIPPLLPIDDETRAILRKVASGGKPVRLGSRTLFVDAQPVGPSQMAESPTARPAVAEFVWNARIGAVFAGVILLALAFFLTVLASRDVS